MTESTAHQPSAPGRLSSLRSLPRPPLWAALPACVLLGTVCGISYSGLTDSEYAATGYTVAVPGKDVDPAAALGYAQAFGRIATSDAVLTAAHRDAGVPVASLRTQVRSETSPDSPMIAVTGTSTRPGQAADIADAVSAALRAQVNDVSKKTGVKLQRFTEAVAPNTPVSPSLPVSVAVGACAGGLIGGLILLVRPRATRRSATTALPSPKTAPAATTAPLPTTATADERELV